MVGKTEASSEDLVGEYLATLNGRSVSTVEGYGTILKTTLCGIRARWQPKG